MLFYVPGGRDSSVLSVFEQLVIEHGLLLEFGAWAKFHTSSSASTAGGSCPETILGGRGGRG